MKHFILGSTAVFAFAVPAAASEYDFRGVQIVGTTYIVEPKDLPATAPPALAFIEADQGFITASLGASAEFGFGGPLFVQGDAVFQSYAMGWDDFKLASAGAHLGYEIGAGTNIGAFTYAEIWDQPDEGDMSVGVEIAGQTGSFFYEAYGAYLFDPLNGTGWEQYHVEATGGYAFGSGFAIELGMHYTDGDLRFGLPGNMLQALANVSYEIAPELSVEAGYVYTDFETDLWDSWESHSIKLALTKEIGGGTSFSQRNYLNLHNGY